MITSEDLYQRVWTTPMFYPGEGVQGLWQLLGASALDACGTPARSRLPGKVGGRHRITPRFLKLARAISSFGRRTTAFTVRKRTRCVIQLWPTHECSGSRMCCQHCQ